MASRLENGLMQQITLLGIPAPTREYTFHATRKWRFDFAWPERKIAAEVEGGVWVQGRHSRGSGFIADLEKYNAATADGWRVYRFSESMITSGEALRILEKALA